MTSNERKALTHLENAIKEADRAAQIEKFLYVNEGRITAEFKYEMQAKLWKLNEKLADNDKWFGELQKSSAVEKIKTTVA